MQGRAPLWGPLAVPVSYWSEFPALLPFSFPHPSAKKAHGGAKTKRGSQEAYIQSLHQCASSLPPQIPYLKRAQLESLLALTSRSIFRAVVLCSQSLAQRSCPVFTEGWGREQAWRQRRLWSGPSLGSSRGRSEHGGEDKVPKTGWEVICLPVSSSPLRPSNNGIKAIGPKSTVHWGRDLGQVKCSVPQLPHL